MNYFVFILSERKFNLRKIYNLLLCFFFINIFHAVPTFSDLGLYNKMIPPIWTVLSKLEACLGESQIVSFYIKLYHGESLHNRSDSYSMASVAASYSYIVHVLITIHRDVYCISLGDGDKHPYWTANLTL